MSGSSCVAPQESRGVLGPGSGSLLRPRDVDVYASSYCSPLVSSVPTGLGVCAQGVGSICGTRAPSSLMCRYMFQTPSSHGPVPSVQAPQRAQA